MNAVCMVPVMIAIDHARVRSSERVNLSLFIGVMVEGLSIVKRLKTSFQRIVQPSFETVQMWLRFIPMPTRHSYLSYGAMHRTTRGKKRQCDKILYNVSNVVDGDYEWSQ